MTAKVRVTTNNDIAYIWWSVAKKIPGALGFSIHRELKDGTARPLPAWVGFDKVKAGRRPTKPRDTDVWPIQSFQWKDPYAPRTGRFRYRIYVVRGTARRPVRDEKPLIMTKFVELREQFGQVRVVFNRGLLSTQAMARRNNDPAKEVAKLRVAIGTANDETRLRLTRELLPALYELLRRVKKGGHCTAALYELTDTELVSELVGAGTTQLILSNANSAKEIAGKSVTIYDGTNKKVRARLHKAKYGITDRMLAGNAIGHNKFIVYHDARGPAAVLTGSTNWTATGLCGQTNNAVLIENRQIANHYDAYWTRLKAEKKMLQGAALRTWARTNAFETRLPQTAGKMKVWFSPNTMRKTKSDKELPVDMAEVFDVIENAKSAVLFLLFNPGKPSIVERVREAELKATAAGKSLYVRGAISDPKTAKEGAVNVFNRSANKVDTVITGVGAVPDDFGYWEKELLKLGHAAIHDKVMVIDPFSPSCVVITGSHNLGYKASFSNDENMLIIRGNRPIAEAFATHVLDIVNHYRWRYKLQELWRKKQLDKAWQDLDETDKWQDKYFQGFLEARDAFVLRSPRGAWSRRTRSASP
jgi:phosphatidylserine/phosphatidylglycerophosphate/cardiolipin synthase-like enzyme